MRHSTILLLILIAHLSIPVRADRPITARGRIVCLDQSDNRIDCDKAPSNRFALQTTDGKLYRFLPADVLTAMFADPRVRQMELQITGRIDAKDQLEIVRVQAIKEGVLSDVYYYCFVCSITAYAPGPCVCCGEDVQLIVTPTPVN
ncbi:MAG: hypothetical protein AB1631_09240 [Acidobacteriota bacterium]